MERIKRWKERSSVVLDTEEGVALQEYLDELAERIEAQASQIELLEESKSINEGII